jgi:hypothetical protein
VFADKLSGKDAARPELAACLDYLRPGDTLVVPSLDRLSRSLADLIAIVTTLRRRGGRFKSLHEALDTTTPGGRLVEDLGTDRGHQVLRMQGRQSPGPGPADADRGPDRGLPGRPGTT